MRAPRRVLAASMLVLESLVVALAGLVARDISHISAAVALTVHGALALACLLVVGLLRSRVGYLLGSGLQVAMIATGFWVPAMFVIGGIFAVLWLTALRVGARVERERAAGTS